MTDNPTTASELAGEAARKLATITTAPRVLIGLEYADARAELASLKRELAEAREVIEPFAQALDNWGDEPQQDNNRNICDHPAAIGIGLGDLRRARAFLARNPDASPDGEGEK